MYLKSHGKPNLFDTYTAEKLIYNKQKESTKNVKR